MNELNHLAIIMDGNGRWAKIRNLARSMGHQKGADAIDDIVKFCIDYGIKNLTLYAFSTENWSRPKDEVTYLIKLAKRYITQKESLFLNNDVKFVTKGDLSAFDDELNTMISHLKDITKNNSNLTLALAINYGSKDEITRACKKLKDANLDITEENITKALDTPEMGDVDLILRTGGEQRLSNFMLWQGAYAELFFTQTFWPDLKAKELKAITDKYKKIDRKFGGL
ncbi:MAG: di-trans,poly-cis-decaprenylcistransferase [Campylobacter sp.]|nr:di-trans,poly-cis-decaprenylcistransferase [Campylobacter sp.]